MKNFSIFLLLATLLAGCNSDIPQGYNGTFSGTISQQQVSLQLSDSAVTVTVNGKTHTEASFVTSFDDAIPAIEKAQAGVYLLPTVVSVEGIPVYSPWGMRQDLSAPFYHDAAQSSDHLQDLYVVIPTSASDGAPFDLNGLSPIPFQGNSGDFYAFVLYVQLDKNASGQINTLSAQIAPVARLSAENASIAGVVGLKMMAIAPEAASAGGDPVLLGGTLTRQ